jgi:hypothetical protein
MRPSSTRGSDLHAALVSGDGVELEQRLFQRHGSDRSIPRNNQWRSSPGMLQLHGTVPSVDVCRFPSRFAARASCNNEPSRTAYTGFRSHHQ